MAERNVTALSFERAWLLTAFAAGAGLIAWLFPSTAGSRNRLLRQRGGRSCRDADETLALGVLADIARATSI